MEIGELNDWGASSAFIKILTATGVKDLYPPQVLALKAGLLTGSDSLVIAAPTASGKTLVAEMAALKTYLEAGGRCIYLVPLRALAREKYEDFSKKYKAAGMTVMQSTGDLDSADPWLHQGNLIISTNEKMDSLLRHRAAWLRDVRLVIADEIHLLRDPRRGPTLEIVLTRLKSLHPHLRFIALSATIPNAPEISNWLGAGLIQSDWRPVPLREGVYYNGAAIFNDGTVRWIEEESRIEALDLALETIRERGQALIFVNTRKAAEAVAQRSGKYIFPLLAEPERRILDEIASRILGSSAEPTRICKKLAECAANGVAFHHAGITSSQRRIVEDAFRANKIKCLAATTTLAMGLNLPSRRVVIRDWWRYESGSGMQPIPAIEIKQMAGRAGRPFFDEYGEAVLVARNKRDEKYLFENYIKGDLEEIDSQLGNEPALRTHILGSIAGAFTTTRGELTDFLGGTFFAHQQGRETLSDLTNRIVGFLEEKEMVTAGDDHLKATRFGRRVSELYIDPVSGVLLREALESPKKKEDFSLLHMIALTPDMMVLSLRQRDRDEMLDIFYENSASLLIADEERFPTDEVLAQLKTASVLTEWIDEIPEDNIVGRFGIGPGDLRTLVDLADWLLYSASEIARLFKIKEAVNLLSALRIRVEYGVKEELVELVRLRGIGRIRARNLYDSGFKNLEAVRKAEVGDLAGIPAMGRTLAEDIKKQVNSSGEKGKKFGSTPSDISPAPR